MKANTKIVHKTSVKSMKLAEEINEKNRKALKKNLKAQINIIHCLACATDCIEVEITRRTTMLAICEELFDEFNVSNLEQLAYKNKHEAVCDHIMEYYIYN